jgi:hypothetical protein
MATDVKKMINDYISAWNTHDVNKINFLKIQF